LEWGDIHGYRRKIGVAGEQGRRHKESQRAYDDYNSPFIENEQEGLVDRGRAAR